MAASLFLQDVLDTPKSLQDSLDAIGESADDLASNLLAHGTRRIVALGNGTSLYASLSSVYLHNALVGPDGTLAWAVPTGEYGLYPSPLSARDAIVGVSVSGEVVDLLDLFERLRGDHRLIGVTNGPDSTLARSVDDLILTKASRSLVPTSTKTFVTSVAALHLLWLGLLKAQGVEGATPLRRELLGTPEQIAASLDLALRQAPDVAERLAPCQRVFVFGSGPSWPLAQEAALVLKEVANVPAEAAHAREMAHGITAVVDETVGIIAVNPPGPGQDMARSVLEQCAALGAVTVEVGEARSGMTVNVPCHDLLSPLIYGGPLFILANEIAARRGVNTDHPQWEADYLRATRRAAK
ncbi:MAG: glutamine--fructose-6-phosphate transaminase [Chloroflexi bacterium]|nr:glutamine--fructose-6-phosphate transaminase [Chloroflexota bacterium]